MASPPPTPALEDDVASNVTLYQVLEVDQNASSSEIQAAFRRRSRVVHPDKHGLERQDVALKEFQVLQFAKDVLLNPDERLKYDTLGHEEYFRLLNNSGWRLNVPFFWQQFFLFTGVDVIFGFIKSQTYTPSVMLKANVGNWVQRNAADEAIWASGSSRMAKVPLDVSLAGSNLGVARTAVYRLLEANVLPRFGFRPWFSASTSMILTYPLHVFEATARSQAVNVRQSGTDLSWLRKVGALIRLNAGLGGFFAGSLLWAAQESTQILASLYVEQIFEARRIQEKIHTAVLGGNESGQTQPSTIKRAVASLVTTTLKFAIICAISTPLKTLTIRAQTAPARGVAGSFFSSLFSLGSPMELWRASGPRGFYAGFGYDILFLMTCHVLQGLR